MSTEALILAAIETAFDKALSLDPVSQRRLATLHGKIIGVELVELGWPLYFVPGPTRTLVQRHIDGEPDALLRGTLAGFRKLSFGNDKTGPLFHREVEILGDSGIGQRFGEILAGVDLDWEEALSRLLGDPLAHAIGDAARRVGGWLRGTAETAREDIAEYLREELRVTPNRFEVEEFLRDVDAFREAVDRLDARVRLLEQRLKSASDA